MFDAGEKLHSLACETCAGCERLHQERACLFGSGVAELDASRVSGSLRKLLSQYRVIKEDCKRRAVVQQRAIQSAVAHVVVMVDSKFVATIIVIIVVIVA